MRRQTRIHARWQVDVLKLLKGPPGGNRQTSYQAAVDSLRSPDSKDYPVRGPERATPEDAAADAAKLAVACITGEAP